METRSKTVGQHKMKTWEKVVIAGLIITLIVIIGAAKLLG